MTKTCLGCLREYDNDVWLSEDGLCSICYSESQHSLWKTWDSKQKKWVEKKRNLKELTQSDDRKKKTNLENWI